MASAMSRWCVQACAAHHLRVVEKGVVSLFTLCPQHTLPQLRYLVNARVGKPGCQIYADARSWHRPVSTLPQVQVLRESFHCLALDFPDQGASDPAPEHDNVCEHFAAAVLATVNILRLKGAPQPPVPLREGHTGDCRSWLRTCSRCLQG